MGDGVAMREVGDGIEDLLELGKVLDGWRGGPGGGTVWLARLLLRIRDRDGEESALKANLAQARFECERGRQNIVVKARQMGITTWVAGRFFLKTITARGVLTVLVAHTREAAEGIFRMVQHHLQHNRIE